MINLNYLTVRVLYQMSCIILSHRKHGEKTDNPPVTVYVNTIETRITFRKSKITNIEIGEYVAHLKIAEVA